MAFPQPQPHPLPQPQPLLVIDGAVVHSGTVYIAWHRAVEPGGVWNANNADVYSLRRVTVNGAPPNGYPEWHTSAGSNPPVFPPRNYDDWFRDTIRARVESVIKGVFDSIRNVGLDRHAFFGSQTFGGTNADGEQEIYASHSELSQTVRFVTADPNDWCVGPNIPQNAWFHTRADVLAQNGVQLSEGLDLEWAGAYDDLAQDKQARGLRSIREVMRLWTGLGQNQVFNFNVGHFITFNWRIGNTTPPLYKASCVVTQSHYVQPPYPPPPAFGGAAGFRESAHRYDTFNWKGMPTRLRLLLDAETPVVQLPPDDRFGVGDGYSCIAKILAVAYIAKYEAYAGVYAPDWYPCMTSKDDQGQSWYDRQWGAPRDLDWVANRLASISVYDLKNRASFAEARNGYVPVETVAEFCLQHGITMTLVNAGNAYSGAVRVARGEATGANMHPPLMLVLKDDHYYWITDPSFAREVSVELYTKRAIVPYRSDPDRLDQPPVPVKSTVYFFRREPEREATMFGTGEATDEVAVQMRDVLDGLDPRSMGLDADVAHMTVGGCGSDEGPAGPTASWTAEFEEGVAACVAEASMTWGVPDVVVPRHRPNNRVLAMQLDQRVSTNKLAAYLLRSEERMQRLRLEANFPDMRCYFFVEDKDFAGNTQPMNLVEIIRNIADLTKDEHGACRVCNRGVQVRADSNGDVVVTRVQLQHGVTVCSGSRATAVDAYELAMALSPTPDDVVFTVRTPWQVWLSVLFTRSNQLQAMPAFQPHMYPDKYLRPEHFLPPVSQSIRPVSGRRPLAEVDVRFAYTSCLARHGPLFDAMEDRGGPWLLDMHTCDVGPWRGTLDFCGMVLVRWAGQEPPKRITLDDPFVRGLTEFRWVTTAVLRDFMGRLAVLMRSLEITHERVCEQTRDAGLFKPVLETMVNDAVARGVPLDVLKRACNASVGLMRKAGNTMDTGVHFFDPVCERTSLALHRLRHPEARTTSVNDRVAFTTYQATLLNIHPYTCIWQQVLEMAAYQMCVLRHEIRQRDDRAVPVHLQTDALFLEHDRPDMRTLLPSAWRVDPQTPATAELFSSTNELRVQAFFYEIGRVKINAVTADKLGPRAVVDSRARAAHKSAPIPPPPLPLELGPPEPRSDAQLLEWGTTTFEMDLLAQCWDAHADSTERPRPVDKQGWRDWFRHIRHAPDGRPHADLSRRAVDAVLKVPEGCAVFGGGGRGKTYLLKRVKDALEARGDRVGVCAFTNSAVHTLQEAGVADARTIHTLLKINFQVQNACANGFGELAKYDTLIIDESSMIPSMVMHKLLLFRVAGRVDPNVTPLRLLFFGDDLQLGPVEHQRAFMVRYPQAFRQLCGDHRVLMQLNKRDTEDTLDEFDACMRTGDPLEGVRMFQGHTKDRAWLARRIAAKPGLQMMFWRNLDRVYYQAMASAQMAAQSPTGLISLPAAKGWRAADPAADPAGEPGATELSCCVGLHVVCHQPSCVSQKRTRDGDGLSDNYTRNERFVVLGHDDDSVHLQRMQPRDDHTEVVHVPKAQMGRFTAGMTVHRMQGRQCEDDAVLVVPLQVFLHKLNRSRTPAREGRQFLELWYTAITRYRGKQFVAIVDLGR